MDLWTTLNSNFSIWFFSSVVLAGISRLFLFWKASTDAKAAARSERADLLLEIEVRTRSALMQLDNRDTVHLAQSGPIDGPLQKYRVRGYFQLLIEAECRSSGIQEGSLTGPAKKIASADFKDPDGTKQMTVAYKEILAYIQARRAGH